MDIEFFADKNIREKKMNFEISFYRYSLEKFSKGDTFTRIHTRHTMI